MRWISTAGVLLGVAGAGACRRLEPVSISRVVLNLPQEFDGQSDERETVRAAIYARLRDDDSIDFHPGKDAGTHVLHLRVQPVSTLPPEPQPIAEAEETTEDASADDAGEAPEPPPLPGIEVRPVQIVLRPLGDRPELEAAGRSDPDVGRVASVLDAFDEGWAMIGRLRRLVRLEDAALLEKLGDPDPRVRAFVITQLGERRNRPAVPALCKAIATEERPELVLRIVGALVDIGDRRAIEPLIDLTRKKSAELVTQIVYAIGNIGGREAEAFLVTVASGHPSPLVQASAKEALSEMQRRSARKK